MLIVFHGESAGTFSKGFADLLCLDAEIRLLPDALGQGADRSIYAAADVVVSARYDRTLPQFDRLGLFHLPSTGYDAVDLNALPPSAAVCNCYGHEHAIAEYVMAAILARFVPLADADYRLRKGDWAYCAGAIGRAHDELAGKTMGLLGFGHIGKAVAVRAKAFDMKVHVANRSAVPPSAGVDRSFLLDDLADFWPNADFLVVSVPLTLETASIVGANALSAMQPSAVVINVGRGPTIDEAALYNALRSNRIAGAVIDTWYRYPKPGQTNVRPSTLPFHELPNVVMTPHMSAWTHGTIQRRQKTIVENVLHCVRGEPYVNRVR